LLRDKAGIDLRTLDRESGSSASQAVGKADLGKANLQAVAR
jgi:hypothetical protein